MTWCLTLLMMSVMVNVVTRLGQLVRVDVRHIVPAVRWMRHACVVVDALRTDLAAPAYTDELRLFVECYDVRIGAQLQFDVVN